MLGNADKAIRINKNVSIVIVNYTGFELIDNDGNYIEHVDKSILRIAFMLLEAYNQGCDNEE